MKKKLTMILITIWAIITLPCGVLHINHVVSKTLGIK